MLLTFSTVHEKLILFFLLFIEKWFDISSRLFPNCLSLNDMSSLIFHQKKKKNNSKILSAAALKL